MFFFSPSVFFCMVFSHVLANPEETDSPIAQPRYVALGETGAPVINRIHNRQVEEGQEEDQKEEVKLRFTLSPLGQIIVQPTQFFPNFTGTTTAPVTPEGSAQNSTNLGRSTTLGLGGSPALEPDLGLLGSQLNASSGGGKLKRPTVGSYFPDWNLDVLSPEQIDYSKYDLIDFAFAVPAENFQLEFTQTDSIQTLEKLVRYGHGNGTKICLSIGGWDGSKDFSLAVRDSSSRQAFAGNIVKMVEEHNLDGIDIDWEYPAQAGVQVTDMVFLDSHGNRMKDVSAFGKVLDHILVMNYDYAGSSATPGPNAPFSNACGDSSQPQSNMMSGITTWKAAGFPPDKILMGLPAYGYINWSSATKLVHKRSEMAKGPRSQNYLTNAANRHLFRRNNSCPNLDVDCEEDSASNAGSCTNGTDLGVDRAAAKQGSGNLKAYPGSQIQFNDLFKWGVLHRNVSDTEKDMMAINGYTLAWDGCSSTSYAFNQALGTVVTFDDTKSIAIKSGYALKSGIGGVVFWDMSGDPHSILTNAARKMLGRS